MSTRFYFAPLRRTRAQARIAGMAEPTPNQPTASRPAAPSMTRGAAYLLVVALVALGNGFLYAHLVRNDLAPTVDVSAQLALAAFFGIFFAGACNMSAQSLSKWLNRAALADRIILFLLVDLAGCATLTVVVRFFMKSLLEGD